MSEPLPRDLNDPSDEGIAISNPTSEPASASVAAALRRFALMRTRRVFVHRHVRRFGPVRFWAARQSGSERHASLGVSLFGAEAEVRL